MRRLVSSNGWDRVIAELESLNHKYVAIGFFGEDNDRLLTIVRANEFGCTIVPKSGQWLTIPTKDTPMGSDGLPMPAKEIPGLFKPKGKKILAVSDGGKLTVMYYLVKKVTIPARPFIRTTVADNFTKYQQMVRQGIDHIAFDGWSADDMLNWIGARAAHDLMRTITGWKRPANAPATIARKGSTHPLEDTGAMRRSVTWKVMED